MSTAFCANISIYMPMAGSWTFSHFQMLYHILFEFELGIVTYFSFCYGRCSILLFSFVYRCIVFRLTIISQPVNGGHCVLTNFGIFTSIVDQHISTYFSFYANLPFILCIDSKTHSYFNSCFLNANISMRIFIGKLTSQ